MKWSDWVSKARKLRSGYHDGSLQRELILRWRAWTDHPFERWVRGYKLEPADIGKYGEWISARWLRRHGRSVLATNYKGIHRGEVDIVCRHGRVLTFVEVKTRTSTDRGRPADAVDKEKQRLIQRGAIDWMRQLGFPNARLRFDIAEVVLTEGQRPSFNIIENAFDFPEGVLIGRSAALGRQ